MDTIFYNGRINTFDSNNSVASAVGVANGRIIGTGSDAELKQFIRSGTESVDLKRAVMFPGFMEAHNHLTIFGYLLKGIDLSASQVSCMDEVLAKVRAEVQQTSPGTWIKGSRYAEYFLAENRHPTRMDLDSVSPDHPVILFHTSFHACTLNSLALKMSGIDKTSPDPQGGKIEKDPGSGEPTGVLHDQAMMGLFNTLFLGDLVSMNQEERINLIEAGWQLRLPGFRT